MKFVIDENVSYGIVERLRSAGHEVVSISELPNRGIPDEEVYTLAIREQAVLITRDYHFTNPIRFPTEKMEGILYIRHGNLKSDEEIAMVQNFVDTYKPQTFRNKLITLYKGRIITR